MSENKWIAAYKTRLENLNRTIQECILRNTSEGILDLPEVNFILRGALLELETQHKEILELKKINLTLKSAINDEMDKLSEAVTGA